MVCDDSIETRVSLTVDNFERIYPRQDGGRREEMVERRMQRGGGEAMDDWR